MKFTEGYWLRSERANAMYASQAYIVKKYQVEFKSSHLNVIHNRDGALDVGTITIEFTSAAENVVRVRSYHHEGYEDGAPSFEKTAIHSPFRFL